jgi:hypothetical protein
MIAQSNDTSITHLTQGWFKDHIKTVINRVNTISGVAYKDDPTIMTWELSNEPQDPPLSWSDLQNILLPSPVSMEADPLHFCCYLYTLAGAI